MMTCTSPSGGRSASSRWETSVLLMAIAPMKLPDHLAGRDIQAGEERCRPVSNVSMRLSRRNARTHRQQPLRTIQRLHLTLLVEARHQRVVRRVEIRSDDIANFLHELGPPTA